MAGKIIIEVVNSHDLLQKGSSRPASSSSQVNSYPSGQHLPATSCLFHIMAPSTFASLSGALFGMIQLSSMSFYAIMQIAVMMT